MYRTLNSDKIVATIEHLERRVGERFPASSLAKVCGELACVAREDKERAARLARPNWWLRIGVVLVLALVAALLAWLVHALHGKRAEADLFGTLQGIDSASNIIVLAGAAIFFMVRLEWRTKRKQALSDLHELRAVIHVIDMHQLTKDPSALVPGATTTAASPERTMTAFEITRYLDYCTEMLSLSAKVAALYAQNSSDDVVIDTVNDLERLAGVMSQKIWQKITMVDVAGAGAPAPAAVEPPSA